MAARYNNLNYPENFLLDILGKETFSSKLPVYWERVKDVKYPLSPDELKGLNYVLSFLNEREKYYVKYRYIDKLTYEKIGKIYGFSGSTASKMGDNIILKCADKSKYITMGYEAYTQYLSSQNNASKPNQDVLSIELADIVCDWRLAYALKRSNIVTLGDLSNMTLDQIKKIRNLGRSSVTKLLTIMKGYGVSPKES